MRDEVGLGGSWLEHAAIEVKRAGAKGVCRDRIGGGGADRIDDQRSAIEVDQVPGAVGDISRDVEHAGIDRTVSGDVQNAGASAGEEERARAAMAPPLLETVKFAFPLTLTVLNSPSVLLEPWNWFQIFSVALLLTLIVETRV